MTEEEAPEVHEIPIENIKKSGISAIELLYAGFNSLSEQNIELKAQIVAKDEEINVLKMKVERLKKVKALLDDFMGGDGDGETSDNSSVA